MAQRFQLFDKRGAGRQSKISGDPVSFFGVGDNSLTLLGFGVDSFVEVISGVGIAHMLIRMKRNLDIRRDEFEKQALKITGISFYLLTAGLIVGAVLSLPSVVVNDHK